MRRSVVRGLGVGAWLIVAACGGTKGSDLDAGTLPDGELPDGASLADADPRSDADPTDPSDGGSPCDLVVAVEGGLSFPATGARAAKASRSGRSHRA